MKNIKLHFRNFVNFPENPSILVPAKNRIKMLLTEKISTGKITLELN